jgi:hypothetical protein
VKKDRDRDRRGEEGQTQGREGWRRTGAGTGGVKKDRDRDRRDEEGQGQEG